MRIRILGAHNCESQNTRLVSILIDDVLALDAGGLTSSLSFTAQQELKAILLTHPHYDHIRDIPAIAMNALLHESRINIISTSEVRDKLAANLLNDKLYPDFLTKPLDNPAIDFTVIKPYQAREIGSYHILAVPVNHAILSVGYQITSPDGISIFYTGDTGPGLTNCWQQISPQLLIIEVTAPNRYEEFARKAGHLTPRLLKREMEIFREIKGYLPSIITVHMNPRQEEKIEEEIKAVSESLYTPIRLGYEGMLVYL